MLLDTFSLVLDVTQGCQLSCQGCQVDKESGLLPDEDTVEELDSFLDELERNHIAFKEIEIGPTDLITSKNRKDLFSHKKLVKIIQRFTLTTINASMIYDEKKIYEELARDVHLLTPENNVILTTPVEMKHLLNNKYMDLILKNVTFFKSKLPNLLEEVTLNIIFDDYMLRDLNKRREFSELFKRANKILLNGEDRTRVNFAFHHGRLSLKNEWNSNSLMNSITSLSREFDSYLKTENNIRPRELPYSLSLDRRGGELLLHRNLLYFRPVVNERITVLDDSYLLQGNWTYENFLLKLLERNNKNLELGLGLSNCKDCEYLSNCADKYIPELLTLCNDDRCLTLLKENEGFFNRPKISDVSKLLK